MDTFSVNRLKDRASGFLASSSIKLRSATQNAAVFVGDVAKDAGSSVVEVAEHAGTVVRSRWSLLQQSRQLQQHQQHSEETVEDRLRIAAASTSTLLKKSLSETKEKMVVGKNKVEEVAKRTLANLEHWHKGQNSRKVFGVHLEIVVQKEKNIKPIPNLVTKCVDFLLSTRLNTEYLFKYEGDELVLSHLMNLFNKDYSTSIPEGVSPVDVAAFLKVYLQMLPEPLLTFNLYDEVKKAQCSIQRLRYLLEQIPPSHYFTLECLTALLLRISQKSQLNKMDAHNLAFELAPVLIWEKGSRVADFARMFHNTEANFKSVSQMDFDPCRSAPISSPPVLELTASRASDVLSQRKGNAYDCEEEVQGAKPLLNGVSDISTQISLDDEPRLAEFAVIEAVQCLIEQHDAIFSGSM